VWLLLWIFAGAKVVIFSKWSKKSLFFSSFLKKSGEKLKFLAGYCV